MTYDKAIEKAEVFINKAVAETDDATANRYFRAADIYASLARSLL